ncbi:cytochrome P450 [Kibdelosporangium philippinense]|uniref:Cytochrome P450 n=1 Tax=Kibdelosporangium philippinense TaxID=211113 RepID=A0ABS8ZMX1_9PSEU|nr:cytochrome P450 [Kibdelosporangium philippinense]MCE7008518.1 cytochrome P450 [Kibdelosporangium philippinense]
MITYPQARTCPYQPAPGYDELREGPPLRRTRLINGQEGWVVSGHREARALLADSRVSSDRTNTGFPMIMPPALAAVQTSPNRPFIVRDDPDHNRIRRMLIPQFTARRLRELQPEIEQIVHATIDDMLAAGPPADLVSAFSLPIPSLVISRLLGVPWEDHEFFQRATKAIVQALDTTVTGEVLASLISYLSTLAQDPPPGLIAQLKEEQVATGAMSQDDLVFTSMLLLGAGHETTSSMISVGVITLIDHPDQLAAFRSDPDTVPDAIEELLRYLTIVEAPLLRVAVADIEIAGEVIKAGEGIVFAGSIANRDPDAFEDPERFDISRTATHHISFGYGVHQCLGQNLARTELRLALSALFERVPTLRLAVPVEELGLRPAVSIQGVDALPVTW